MNQLHISQPFKKLIDDLKSFIISNKIVVSLIFIFSFAVYGFMLSNFSMTIDEETWIVGQSPKLWITQGRFGIYFFDLFLSPQGKYVPFLWDFLSVIVLCIAAIIFFLSISMIYNKYSKFSIFVFCAFFYSMPFVFGELMAYSMFNFQMSIAILFISVSVYFTFQFFDKKNKSYFIMAIPFLFVAISIYQAFVGLYITMVVAYCLIIVLENYDKMTIKMLYKNIRSAVYILIVSLALYYLVDKLACFFIIPSTNYLSSNYWGWGNGDPIFYTLFLACANVIRVIFGLKIKSAEIYGGQFICITTILFIILIIAIVLKSKNMKQKLWIVLFSFLLIISPFILSIGLGTYKTHGRMLVALPLLGAISWLFILNFIKKYKIINNIAVITAIVVLFYQASLMNNLFYSSYLVYELDKTTANQVIDDIKSEGFNYKEKPIVYIGMYIHDKKDIETSGSNGGSFFSWDDGNITRIVNFANALGYKVLPPTVAQIQDSLTYTKSMSVWPEKNSIKQTREYIIVNFSIPSKKWYQINHVIENK